MSYPTKEVESEHSEPQISPQVSNEVFETIDEDIVSEQIFDENVSIDMVDVPKNKDDIFRDLFARLMRSKIMHQIPDVALDEMLSAFLQASQRSNEILKKSLKHAISSVVRPQEASSDANGVTFCSKIYAISNITSVHLGLAFRDFWGQK